MLAVYNIDGMVTATVAVQLLLIQQLKIFILTVVPAIVEPLEVHECIPLIWCTLAAVVSCCTSLGQ